jgi:hypothetical protein
MNKPRQNSRDKGGRGERAAAKEFNSWWGTDFARTPSSGGFATQRFRDDWNAAGDLVTPDKNFPFCVECKWVEGWALEQLLKNDSCLVFSWWRQALGECPEDKLPLLVFKKNNHPFYCMVEAKYFPFQSTLNKQNVRYYTLPLSEATTKTTDMTVHIMLLEDFFKTIPLKWVERKDTLTSLRAIRKPRNPTNA